MTPMIAPDTPAKSGFERYCLTYPRDRVNAYYCDGATVEEGRATHPLAVVEALSTRGYSFTSYSTACLRHATVRS
jgi:hypothetical protein